MNVDLIPVAEASGVTLKKRGNKYVGLCPFHLEKTPSFFIFPDNHFKCFGCGESGDSIDFVQKIYKCSFKEALKILGIERGTLTPETKTQIKRQKRKHILIKHFRGWEVEKSADLGLLITGTHHVMRNLEPSQFEMVAELYHALPLWEYHLGILCGNDDELKFELWKKEYAGTR